MQMPMTHQMTEPELSGRMNELKELLPKGSDEMKEIESLKNSMQEIEDEDDKKDKDK